MKAIDYIVLVVALLLIVLIMMQESKDNIQDAFSGEKTDLFKNQKQRGIERVMSIVTAFVAVLFLVLTFVATIVPR
ncbi:MAG: preprotein translocase subunit SecG [Acholeplasmatales bacterium]|nr:preprotein translocase subunit SecG [Acholeplasmatales bacterium]